MHSAQKREMPTETPQASSSGVSATGFAKVLTSIQSLQQRLDDFSVEDASRAGEKARAIIDELGCLQKQLNAIAKLKEAVAEANKTIADLPQQSFDPVDIDGLDKHPQLRAIIQAGKLIRMHRLLLVAQASAESVSLDLGTEESQFTPPSSQSAGPDSNALSEAPTSEVVEVAPGAESAVEPPVAAGSESAIRTESDHTVSAEIAAPPHHEPATQANPTAPRYEFGELKLEMLAETPPKAAETDRAAAKPAKNSPFDQRLLDDLIETYGEFTPLRRVSEAVSSSEACPQQPDEVHASSPDPISDSRELAPAEPAFVQAAAGALMVLPAPEDKPSAAPAAEEIVSGKSHGEIDRQLKSIIRDYGEYDLYSHRKSTIDFKTAAIAVVTVLGLLLGGFYIYKAPATPVPVAIDAKQSSDHQTGTVPAQNLPKQNN